MTNFEYKTKTHTHTHRAEQRRLLLQTSQLSARILGQQLISHKPRPETRSEPGAQSATRQTTAGDDNTGNNTNRLSWTNVRDGQAQRHGGGEGSRHGNRRLFCRLLFKSKTKSSQSQDKRQLISSSPRPKRRKRIF